jgi:N-terminal domain of toast_rack, DUF2154
MKPPPNALARLALAGMVSMLAGCDFRPPEYGPIQTENVSVPLGTAQRSNIELDLSAGELNLHGGAEQLLEGSLEYNVPSWRPEIRSTVVGSSTDVTIKQPEGHPSMGHVHYKWELAANDNLVTDVAVNCGAGKAAMQLGSLQLRAVNVNIGAGEVQLDLRGRPKRDYDVAVSGGVGQATIYLPQNVGIEAEAHGGIGHIEVRGLRKHGDLWRNDLYDTAKVSVRVKVHGGIGEIRLLAD